MKQTAIEWLEEQIEKDSDIIFYERNLHPYEKYIEQAKQMEKERIIDANRDGVDMVIAKERYITGEQYYNETYGGNNE